MPPTDSGFTPAASIAARTAATVAAQMSAEDCSTMSPASRQVAITRRALESNCPREVKTPARTLPVPTSTPMNASSMTAPIPGWAPKFHLPGGARKRRVDKARDAQAYILHYYALYSLTYAMLLI